MVRIVRSHDGIDVEIVECVVVGEHCASSRCSQPGVQVRPMTSKGWMKEATARARGDHISHRLTHWRPFDPLAGKSVGGLLMSRNNKDLARAQARQNTAQ